VAAELAAAFDDQPVFPFRTVVDTAGEHFPGASGPVLLLATENQGVCSWGLSLGEEGSVLVGGDLAGHDEPATEVYAADLETFVATRRWDLSCVGRDVVVQAQATTLDDDALAALMAGFAAGPATAWWPTAVQHRFARDTARILLWSDPAQCDWWVSAGEPADLERTVRDVLPLSNLREAMWSVDVEGQELLDDVRR
jgi:hypothetical protein